MAAEMLTGRLTANGHEHFIRVYFEDTDFSGVVYHANYVKYFERGRTDWLRLLGVSHTDLANGKYGPSLVFVVRSLLVDYLRSARIDDILRIETRTKELSGARAVVSQFAYRGEELLARAEVTVVLIAPDGRPKRLPDEIVRLLSSQSQQIASRQ